MYLGCYQLLLFTEVKLLICEVLKVSVFYLVRVKSLFPWGKPMKLSSTLLSASSPFFKLPVGRVVPDRAKEQSKFQTGSIISSKCYLQDWASSLVWGIWAQPLTLNTPRDHLVLARVTFISNRFSLPWLIPHSVVLGRTPSPSVASGASKANPTNSFHRLFWAG